MITSPNKIGCSAMCIPRLSLAALQAVQLEAQDGGWYSHGGNAQAQHGQGSAPTKVGGGRIPLPGVAPVDSRPAEHRVKPGHQPDDRQDSNQPTDKGPQRELDDDGSQVDS